jgi:hypothetical protein
MTEDRRQGGALRAPLGPVLCELQTEPFCPQSPVICPLTGGVAQLGERLLCKQEVIGSIPFTSTTSGIRGQGSGNRMDVPHSGAEFTVPCCLTSAP